VAYFLTKEELLNELEETHSQKELAVMEMHQGVEKAAEKIETASRFTERVLAHGNGVEVLSMKKPIMTQLLMLLDNMPRVITDVNIEFRVDPKAFAVALLAACGQLKKNGNDSKVCSIELITCKSINVSNQHLHSKILLLYVSFRYSSSHLQLSGQT